MSQRTRRRSSVLTIVVAMIVTLLAPIDSASAAPPPDPMNLTPSGTAVSGNVTLAWDPVVGAVSYQLQMSAFADFGTKLYDITTANTTFTPYNQVPVGTIYWRVRARNSTSEYSNYTETNFNNSLSGPTTSAPSEGEILDFPSEPPTFSWTTLPTAVSYRLEVDNAPDFVGASYYITYTNTFTLLNPQVPGQTYYWRVRGASGNNGGGVLSDWSDTSSYDYTWSSAPSILSPANTNPPATVTDIEMVWGSVLGADRYELEVSKNIDFSGTMEIDLLTYSTRFAPLATLDNGSYFWRVRARDYDGNLGPWSVTGVFTREWSPAPTLTAPSDGAVEPEPMRFSWSAVDHASRYEIQVAESALDFTPNYSKKCYTTHTSIMPYTGPSGCTAVFNSFAGDYGFEYVWRVRGIDETTGVLGIWSPVWTTSRSLDNPNPATYSPAHDAIVSVPTLSWGAVPNVDDYTVRVYKSDGFTLATQVTTSQTSWTPTSRLAPADGPFRWYVISVEEGHPGVIPASFTWSTFNLVDPIGTASPEPLTPTYNATSPTMPSMSWTAVTGADNYDIYLGNAGTGIFGATPWKANLPHNAYTHPDNLGLGSYDYFVVAQNGSTPLASGAVNRFTLSEAAQLGPLDRLAPAHCPPAAACSELTSTPRFDWTPIPGATKYYVYLAYDVNFTNIFRTYVSGQSSFIPNEELPDNDAGQAYYWHVRGWCGNRYCSYDPQGATPAAPSSAFQKRSAPVLLTSPVDAATVANQVRFEWQDYLATNPSDIEAERYRIQVSTVPSFSTIIDDRYVDQTYYTAYLKTYPEGPLYWKVRAVDGSGNQLTWSDTRSLVKSSPAPALLTPANNASSGFLPTLRWSPQPFASAYVIEVAKNADVNFSSGNRKVLVTTAFAEHTPTVNLPVGSYAWRVRREDGESRDGPWSAARVFTITGAAPTLLNPPNGATLTDDNVAFSWTAVPGAASYRFQRSTTINFLSLTENRSTVMTSWAPTSTIATGTWYWRVIALNSDGVEMGTSAVRSFGKYANLPSVPRSVGVVNGAGTVQLSWLPPAAPGSPALNGYVVTLQPGNVTRNLSADTLTTTFYGLTNGLAHTLTVAAKNSDATGPAVTKAGFPNGCGGTPFSDVASDHPFCEEIAWLFDSGITTGSTLSNGTKLFKPSDVVTRQAMGSFLHRFAGEPAAPTSPAFFADVSVSHPFYLALQWMYDSGLSTGSPNPPGKPLYKPTDSVSRMALSAFLHRYEGDTPSTLLSPFFSDVGPTHPFYGHIQWMADTGLSTGTPNPPGDPLYKPTPAVSRMAMAAFLFRFDGMINP